MKTVQYLDAVKKKLAIASDYGLQAPLGVTKQTVSRYRNGGTFDHVIALRVAEILELAAERIITDMELERAPNQELQEVWKRIARKVAGVVLPAAMAIGAASFGALPSPAQASGPGFNISGIGIHIVRRRSPFAAFVAWVLGMRS